MQTVGLDMNVPMLSVLFKMVGIQIVEKYFAPFGVRDVVSWIAISERCPIWFITIAVVRTTTQFYAILGRAFSGEEAIDMLVSSLLFCFFLSLYYVSTP